MAVNWNWSVKIRRIRVALYKMAVKSAEIRQQRIESRVAGRAPRDASPARRRSALRLRNCEINVFSRNGTRGTVLRHWFAPMRLELSYPILYLTLNSVGLLGVVRGSSPLVGSHMSLSLLNQCSRVEPRNRKIYAYHAITSTGFRSCQVTLRTQIFFQKFVFFDINENFIQSNKFWLIHQNS